MAETAGWAGLNVTSLKEECRKRSLPTSKRKAELIAQLEDYEKSDAKRDPTTTTTGSSAAPSSSDAALVTLQTELSQLRPSEIRKRAAASDKIKDEELDDALDAADPKMALVALLVDAERKALLKAANTKQAESKFKKMAIRSASALVMFGVFVGTLYAGHGWVCLMSMFIQAEVFREMVNVRYAKGKVVPFFRTIQWCWFVAAAVYLYGDVGVRCLMRCLRPEGGEDAWSSWKKTQTQIAFVLYCCIFVATVCVMKKDQYRFQMNNLAWTFLTIMLVVVQMCSILQNLFAGLFWFTLPFLLVVINDTGAYFSGFTLGKKIIKKPFLKLSPNKTWEGFIGGGILTIVAGYYFPLIMSTPWFRCPQPQPFQLWADALHCTPDQAFSLTTYPVLVPRPLAPMFVLFGYEIDKCELQGPSADGVLSDQHCRWPGHKHLAQAYTLYPAYTTTVEMTPVQVYGTILGVFASLVAPFGGFFASGIKRAYDVKDFESFIPGHGGLMDRFDCQFIMGVATWVLRETMVNPPTETIDQAVRQLVSQFSSAEVEAALQRIAQGT